MQRGIIQLAKWHKSRALVLLTVWVTATLVAVLLTTRARSRASAICEIEISLELPPDIAQPFGSIFEISDHDGNLIARAFAPETSSLFHRSDGRHINFFVKGGSPELALPRVLSRPSLDHAGSCLFILSGELFATTRARLNQADDLRVLKNDEWQPATGPPGLLCDGLQFAIPVQGFPLVASHRGVEWGGVRVFVPEEGMEGKYFYYYSGGFLIAYRYGNTKSGALSRLSMFKWVPGDPPLTVDSTLLSEVLPIDYPLCFGALGRKIIFSMNSSKRVYAIDLDSFELRCIFEDQGSGSWQGYAMTQYFDRLLIGQYPSGQVYETDGRDVRPFVARIPLGEAWSWEAQSFGHFHGQLLAGIWPWGQIYGYDNKSWRLLGRCFSEPAITHSGAPFEQESKSSGQVSNAWGQRINTMLQFGNRLFVSTMNKSGSSSGEGAIGEAAQQYGSVLCYPIENHLDWSFRWRSRTTLLFRVWKDRAEIYQDGLLVASAAGEFSELRHARQVRWGGGIAGDCVGLLTDSRLSIDRGQP
jgi:hypothetical protein